MRIISGRLKGLNFTAPQGAKTHPMSEKARGGLFNALGDIDRLEILDTFSGSGAIAFEAVSRGAKSVISVEADMRAYKVIKQNINELRLDSRIRVVNTYVKSWLNTNPNLTFDIIVADPPYKSVNIATLDKLPSRLKTNGLFILSWPASYEIVKFDGVEIVKNKNYGDAQLVFYRKIS